MSQLILFLFGCTFAGIAALAMFLASKRALQVAKIEREISTAK